MKLFITKKELHEIKLDIASRQCPHTFEAAKKIHKTNKYKTSKSKMTTLP
jgi:hypothetical protein